MARTAGGTSLAVRRAQCSCYCLDWMTSLLAALWLAGASALASPPVVLVVRNAELGAEEGRLVEALRIYTRDLDCRVVVSGKAPAVLEQATLETIARQARAEGAEVAAWVNRRGDGRMVYFLLSVRDLDVRETEVVPLGADRAAQAVALKVRTLLSRRPGPDVGRDAVASEAPSPVTGATPGPRPETASTSAAVRPTPSGPAASLSPPAPSPPPEPAVPAEALPSSPAPSETAAMATAIAVAAASEPPPPPPAPPPFHWVALSAAYGIFLPLDSTWRRRGLMLSGEVQLGHRPEAVFVDSSFTTRAQATSQGFTTKFKDVPIGVGVHRRWQGPHLGAVVGPRACLHAFEVSTSSTDGRSGSSQRFSAGLGGLGRIELNLGSSLMLYGGGTVEALVPTQNFTISGRPATRTGPLLLGATAGVTVAIP